MDRPLPNMPFDREPRSAGYPPIRHHSRQETPPIRLPGPTPRYSDPGPSVPQNLRNNDFSRHYSVASTASTTSSVFGTSYSISSASSDERRPSRGDDGYISPPVSRRTSEATKLPSIHELAKDISAPPPVPPNPPPPPPTTTSKRDSLSTISSRASSHHEPLPFPPEYPGSSIAVIPKARSNSHPTLNSSTFPPPAYPPSGPPHPYPSAEGRATPIARAIGLNHQMTRLVRDYEILQDHSRHIYHTASQFKDVLSRDLTNGSDQFEIPSADTINELFARIDEINMRLRDIAAYQSVISPFQQQHHQIKQEEDHRMQDVIQTPSRPPPFTNTFPHSPRSMGSMVYKDPGSPTEMYWQDGVRTKYKKRSRAAPPGRCHSCSIEQTPEWRRGPDGARTLCNACGLHYAKLTKRKEREQAQNAENGNDHQQQQQLEQAPPPPPPPPPPMSSHSHSHASDTMQ